MENSQTLNIEQLVPILRSELSSGRPVSLTVRSNSMLPLLKRGDQIELIQSNVAELRQGDIVTIVETAASAASGQADLLTHRLWQSNSSQMLTRGDHLLRFDTAVSSKQLLGKVVARRRRRTLRLDVGLGQKLHKHLAKVAKWESTKLATENQSNQRLAVRLRHRLLLCWGSFLVQTTHLLTFIGML